HRRAIYPPPPQTGGITITNEDEFCLNSGEFLNDVIIDFYLKYIMLELVNEKDRARSYVFSSFFYKQLTHTPVGRHKQSSDTKQLTPSQRRHKKVQKWTRNVDIFEKDFIFVPINEASHWYLAVICFPQCLTQDAQSLNEYRAPCILIFDSLRGPCRSKVVGHLRDYLNMEWKTRKEEELGSRVFDKRTIKMCTPHVPQQGNYSDCGIFLLQYVQQMFEKPITNFSIPIKNLIDWFEPRHCLNKREEIRNVIREL
uniref:Ubiquitin-like protease family profile domain-containing protein n=1 Tax=Ciona savignyi TaxID=51511 RepID=H2ZMA9_CIOSA